MPVYDSDDDNVAIVSEDVTKDTAYDYQIQAATIIPVLKECWKGNKKRKVLIYFSKKSNYCHSFFKYIDLLARNDNNSLKFSNFCIVITREYDFLKKIKTNNLKIIFT